jgi:hypothetical protein
MIDEVYLCSNKCRLCLCNEKFQIPIFGEVAQEMQICLKIRTCLPIKVGNYIGTEQSYFELLFMHH